jgi:hypothetical protein
LSDEAAYIKGVIHPPGKKNKAGQSKIQLFGQYISGWLLGAGLSMLPILFSWMYSYYSGHRTSFLGNFEIIYVLVTATAVALSDSRRIGKRNIFFPFQLIIIIVGAFFYSLCKMKVENPALFPRLSFESDSFAFLNGISFGIVVVLNMSSYLMLFLKRSDS